MVNGFNENDLKRLKIDVTKIREDADKSLSDGKLVVHKGLILPKEYKTGDALEIHIEEYPVKIDGIEMNMTRWIFTSEIHPRGALVDIPACQALMSYTFKAFRQWHERTQQLQLESAPDLIINYKGLWISTAKQYDADPNAMAVFQPKVDKAFYSIFGQAIPEQVKRGTQVILHPYAE